MPNKEFSSIQVKTPKRNLFDLTHDVKFSGNMGYLIPALILDCIPGDLHNISNQTLIRLAPLVAPMMHRVDVSFHCFFVPNRIVWSNWEEFITNTKTGGVLPAAPFVDLDGVYAGNGLCDYMGLPNPEGISTNVSAIPFAAYQSIYNEFYRDENLITSGIWDGDLTDGDNTADATLTDFRKRAWEHDYFTSCLPFPQKGTAVDIPLGNVSYDNTQFNHANPPNFIQSDNAEIADGGLRLKDTFGGTTQAIHGDASDSQASELAYDPAGTLITEATTINDFRTAEKIQEWLELAARGGTRYAELLKAFFGIKVQDARLQRPEYIYGSKTPIQISEVLQTSESDTTPQGNMAGHGVGVQAGNTGRYYCHEHGYIIGLISVLPKTAYQQGVAKHWLKLENPMDYYFEQFAHLGEQAVQNRELKVDHADPLGTFGYIPRYSEHKYMSSRVAGDFKTSLDHWTMARIFATDPSLNAAFITADPTNRVFAVEDAGIDKLWIQHLNVIKSIRPIPKFSTPIL